MKAYLTRRYIFSASHRLQNDAMSDAENLRSTASATTRMDMGTTTPGSYGERAGRPPTGMICNLVDLDEQCGADTRSL